MTTPRRKLLLVDGTGAAYRAFFAIAEMSTRAGLPTNAVFGFIKMLRQMEQAWAPTHWCVVFDGGLPAARMAALETYKAHREEMPESLRNQLGLINEYLACAGVAFARMEGEEADDIIATVVAKSAAADADVLIATSDKDMFQLVDDRVCIVPMTKGGEKVDHAAVVERTGVTPEKTVEWLALTGDSADNIPGVPGVGPKTATKLLQEFGGLDQLWGQLDRVTSERIRKLLGEHRPAVERNLQLVRLRRDLPYEPDWTAYERKAPDPDRLLPFLDRMEFHGMSRDLREEASRLF